MRIGDSMKFEDLNKEAKEAIPIVRENYTISKENRKALGRTLKARKGTFMIPAKTARELFGVPDDSKATIKSIISHADAEAKKSFYKVGRRLIKVKKADGTGEAEEQVWAVISKREPKKAKKPAEKTVEDKPAEEKPAVEEKPLDATPQPPEEKPTTTEEKPSLASEHKPELELGSPKPS